MVDISTEKEDKVDDIVLESFNLSLHVYDKGMVLSLREFLS